MMDIDPPDVVQDSKLNEGENETVTIQKIQELLKTKNDTSRFVGLALLKSVLDNSQQLREDESSITGLWQSISPKFLDRLLRSGSKQSSKDAKDMIDIAVAVLHTFATLLPEHVRKDSSIVDRIPALVSVVLHSSNETTLLIIQTLLTLVNSPEGAKAFVAIDDVSPLVEAAPSQPLILDVFLHAYAQCVISSGDSTTLQSKIDQTVAMLVVSFKGTDAVTLLAFLDSLLRRLDPESTPANPSWLKSVVAFIRNLVTSKPTPAGRAAYTNLTASMLQIYPAETSRLLFSDDVGVEKPFFYLLMNLVLVDLRSAFPALLEKLNSPEYENISRRLASAFDIVSAFLGFLVRFLEDEDADERFASIMLSPDLLLKLRTSISETMSLAIEYLRDRWDASVAGAMGLHPEARVGTAKTSSGSHYTLAWDSKTDMANQDPLILSAIRALAIWLREDDNETLRKEASGLSDMMLDLYKNSPSGRFDFRGAVLVALEGIVTLDKGIAAFLENEGWEILVRDMLAIFEASSSVNDASEAGRGIEIVRVLLPVVEREQPGSREAWMAVVTAVAAWDVPTAEQASTILEFQIAVLQLVTALLSNTHTAMQRRYVHSISAVLGIAAQLKGKVRDDPVLVESLEDVESTLGSLR
ncbi:hypothetical protein N0V93_004957 [Gnomoniopsis smithogilvyi]|uniref:Duf1941 family protein n=1 Tax=Gnomoniopsis smithogilvyi TaxID=1191159 RepID=A0A9W9CXK8_9PEZI|nr:hypothetical protein N0V93_004957 [Gnomoniopsis smithogilvyi]